MNILKELDELVKLRELRNIRIYEIEVGGYLYDCICLEVSKIVGSKVTAVSCISGGLRIKFNLMQDHELGSDIIIVHSQTKLLNGFTMYTENIKI